MEALHGHLAPGEQTGAQHHPRPAESPPHLTDPQPTSPSSQQKHHQPHQTPHDTPQQPKPPGRRQHAERKRLRHQRQSVDSDAPPEVKHGGAATAAKSSDRVPGSAAESAAESAASTSGPAQSKQEPEPQEGGGTPKQKRERKPQRPGKYVCTYCGRACAKPSVLQKHIRSHTGERPYPCAPCGFSFKTKSNLYKHRKSHTHRVKAGLALGEPRSLDETVTESEDESKQLSSAAGLMEKQGSVASDRSHDTDAPKGPSVATDDSSSYAVKKRLAMRLSRGKQGPLGSSDEKSSSLLLGSRGSTESGYFSRSESTEQSGDSPPNTTTSAKSYAEIILGKYGRLGQLHARLARNQNQQASTGSEEKGVPFTVPKKQVIDHITKLITINEAVVDTSKIDSVKPRRFSLTRKSSNESQKGSSAKEQPIIHSPKPADPGYKNSGSITMGVPCEKFHHHHHHHQQQQSVNAEPPTSHTSTAPLLRSHSMPSAACTFDPSGGSPRRFRLSQSFDEQPSAAQASRRFGMLRRQPAIEIPLEPPKEDYPSPLYRHDTVPDHKQSKPQPYECEACGTGCKDWDGYKAHKQRLCVAQHPLAASEVAICQTDPRLPLANHPSRPAALAMRKRRKEESFEFDDPSVPVASSSPTSALSSAAQCREESVVVNESSKRPAAAQTFSVIQHTSSFEKQETLPCTEHQGTEPAKSSLCHEDQQALHHQKQTQQPTKPPPRKLVRQYNVQVPEILVTEDSTNPSAEPPSEQPTPAPKPPLEKPEEFQWPQRSPTLAQLPIEKLPPKKKRLRLAEAAQSSGDSSFDSVSLPPRSPSQDSSASYASSRSASFEESGRTDMAAVATTAAMAAAAAAAATPLRRSRAPHMLLTVPGLHQHREMRRSASEQAPHDPPHGGALTAENRSKSFDYSCLSPERTAVGWRDRRKCLLMRHSAVRDPDEVEEGEPIKRPVSPFPDPVNHPGAPSRASPSSRHCSASASSPLTGDALLYNPNPSLSRQEHFSQWKICQNMLVGNTPIHDRTVGPSKEEAHTPAPGPYPPQGPSGAARAHYLTVATGLKLEIPAQTQTCMSEYSGVRARAGPCQAVPPLPHITTSPEVLRPPTTSPVVAVRLHADTHTPACAIYTTRSQPSPPGLQEPVCSSLTHHLTVPMDQGFQAWSEEGPRSSGSGGNKRMLSPSNSIELHPETQQQQKRVKEEDGPREGEDGESGEAAADASKKEEEDPGSGRSVRSPVTRTGPPLLSLHQANTCHSWCYLNYVKPNPSPSDEDKPSVYSSWSTATGYDPNPPGLSSKMALSLLHCKQRRLSPAIYTMSPISPMSPMSTPSVTQPMEPEDNQRPSSAEVHDVWSGVPTDEGQQSEQRHAPTGEGRRSSRGHAPNEEGRRSEQRHAPTEEGRRSARGHAPSDEGQWSEQRHSPTGEGRRSTRGHTPTDEGRRSTKGQATTDEDQRSARDHPPTDEGQRSSGQNRSNSHEEEGEEEEEEKEEEESGEEVRTSSKREPPPQVSICAGRSSEGYGCVRGRRGGKCECEECGSSFRRERPGALRKHTCPPTPHATPCICKLCSFAVNTQGNLAKHVKSKAHEKCHKDVSCSLCHTHEGVCEEPSACPDDPRDLRHPGPHDGRRPAEDEENAQGDDEDREQTTSSPPQRPTHPDGRSLQRGAGARRGLFARQRSNPSVTSRDPSSSSSPSAPSVPCHRSPEDPASPRASPKPHPSPDCLSPSSCHVSSSPMGRVSPAVGRVSPAVGRASPAVGRVSPGRDVQSQGAPAAATATLAVCPSRDAHATETRDRPTDRPTSKARLQRAVSVLSPRRDPAPSVLSHLPLHSQHPARPPSLMIPIGGLHMIQPRSTAPLYTLVTKRPPQAPAPPVPASSTPPPRPPRGAAGVEVEVEEGGGTEEEQGSWNARRRSPPVVPAEERTRRRRRRGGSAALPQQCRDPPKEPVAVEEEEDGGTHSGSHHHHRAYEEGTTATTADRSWKKKKNASGGGGGGGGEGHGSPSSVPAGEGGRRGRRRRRRRPVAPAPLRCQQQQDPPLTEEPAEEEGDDDGAAQSGVSRRRHRASRETPVEEETVSSSPSLSSPRHDDRDAPEPSGGEPRKESKTTARAGCRRSSGSADRCCSRSDAKVASTLCRAATDAHVTKRAVQPPQTAPPPPAGHSKAPSSSRSQR